MTLKVSVAFHLKLCRSVFEPTCFGDHDAYKMGVWGWDSGCSNCTSIVSTRNLK